MVFTYCKLSFGFTWFFEFRQFFPCMLPADYSGACFVGLHSICLCRSLLWGSPCCLWTSCYCKFILSMFFFSTIIININLCSIYLEWLSSSFLGMRLSSFCAICSTGSVYIIMTEYCAAIILGLFARDPFPRNQ